VFKKLLHGREISKTDRMPFACTDSYVAQVVRRAFSVRRRATDRRRSGCLARLRHERAQGLHVRDADQLKRGSDTWPTIGSTAPFIGPLWHPWSGSSMLSVALRPRGPEGCPWSQAASLRLWSRTALGIFVAIPAVAAFNHFTGQDMRISTSNMNRGLRPSS